MNELRDKVLRESVEFRRQLPELLRTHSGKWVVFVDGKVVKSYASEDKAYEDALKICGPNTGFLIELVADIRPTPITAGMAFGIC